MCIKVCRSHAKKATTQSMDRLQDFKYKVALPAPSLYAQFKNQENANVILTALKMSGFDEVFEVSRTAEMVTDYTKKLIEEGKLKKPIISSACPVIVRLICMRFPSMVENILPVIPPVEVAAIAAKNHMEDQGIPRQEIGAFFISPCAAKNSYTTNALGIEASQIDGVISMQDIYIVMLNNMRHIKEPEILLQCSDKGIDWAISGGERRGVELESAIYVDGIDNVIKVLEELENGQLQDVDFIEGLACSVGCLGGPLALVNGFVAKNRLRIIERKLDSLPRRVLDIDESRIPMDFTKPLEPTGVLKLDGDMAVALEKMERIEDIYSGLPGIDCGACGSPTCRALAEDIVQDNANQEDCVFTLRSKVKELAGYMMDLAAKLPQTISDDKKE